MYKIEEKDFENKLNMIETIITIVVMRIFKRIIFKFFKSLKPAERIRKTTQT